VILHSDVQDQLADKTGGFIWKVEQYPHWLQVYVDTFGNTTDGRDGRRKTEDWFKTQGEQVKAIVGALLGPQFGELYVSPQNMGRAVSLGSCCRTGCAGCLNGTADQLLPNLSKAAQT
jgi:hypothetical protein